MSTKHQPIDLTITECSAIYNGHQYWFSNRLEKGWTVLRWPADGPRIPPLGQYLNDQDEWKPLINATMSDCKRFPLVNTAAWYIEKTCSETDAS